MITDAGLDHLDRLEAARRPFEPLCGQLIADLLRRLWPSSVPPARVIEIGSGAGRLGRLLPRPFADLLIETEIALRFARRLRQRDAAGAIVRADVHALPFLAGTIDAVFGLCVLDVLADPQRGRDEIRRVLAPGGRLVHLLDMTTNLEPLFRELVGKGEVALPNFLADVPLLFPDLPPASIPGHGPLDDLLCTPRAEFAVIVDLLGRMGHPLAALLGEYAGRFDPADGSVTEAVRAYVAITSDPGAMASLSHALASLFVTLRAPPYDRLVPFAVAPVSSSQHFQDRMASCFGTQVDLQVELHDVVYARRCVPRDALAPVGPRFVARWVGRQVALAEPPGEPIGAAVQGTVVQEAAVLALVVRRVR